MEFVLRLKITSKKCIIINTHSHKLNGMSTFHLDDDLIHLQCYTIYLPRDSLLYGVMGKKTPLKHKPKANDHSRLNLRINN